MKRTAKRSRSGATTQCHVCGKKLRGEKGLKAHVAGAHPEAVVAVTPPSVTAGRDISPARGEIRRAVRL